MRSRFTAIKKHSLLGLGLLLSSGCACLPDNNRIVRLNPKAERSRPVAAMTLTGSSEHSYVFFNGNAGTITRPSPVRPDPQADDVRESTSVRVVLNSNDAAPSVRERGSFGRNSKVIFFSPSPAETETPHSHLAATEPPREQQSMQRKQLEASHTAQAPQPASDAERQISRVTAREVPSAPQTLRPNPPAGRVVMREQMEPLVGRHTRKAIPAITASHSLTIQPASPARLPRTSSFSLPSAALPSVRRLQPLLTVSQVSHRRHSTQPELTESPVALAASVIPVRRAAAPAVPPVLAAVPVEAPAPVALTQHATPERRIPLRGDIPDHDAQPSRTILQVSATQSQVFHPRAEIQPEQPPLRPIPMMPPPANPVPVPNPCDCDPCKETTVHTDQIAALFRRVNDMEAALKRSHQSLATLEKSLSVANSDIVRLKRDVQYWQQEFGRLEASVQKQHESDIAALNRISEMLGLLIEDATGSTDLQMAAPTAPDDTGIDVSAQAATEGEVR